MNPSEEVRCQFSCLGQEDGPAQDAGRPAGARDPGGRLGEDRSGRATRFGSSQHGCSLGPQGYSRPMPTRWGRASPLRWSRQLAPEQEVCWRGQPCSRSRATGPAGSGRGLAGVWARACCGHGEGVTQDGELGAGSDELPFPSQGSEAQSGVLDFRAFQASPLPPTSLGHRETSAHPGYSAWKVSGAHTLWGQNLWA